MGHNYGTFLQNLPPAVLWVTMPSNDAAQFVRKWEKVEAKETAVSQTHFNELCELLDRNIEVVDLALIYGSVEHELRANQRVKRGHVLLRKLEVHPFMAFRWAAQQGRGQCQVSFRPKHVCLDETEAYSRNCCTTEACHCLCCVLPLSSQRASLNKMPLA